MSAPTMSVASQRPGVEAVKSRPEPQGRMDHASADETDADFGELVEAGGGGASFKKAQPGRDVATAPLLPSRATAAINIGWSIDDPTAEVFADFMDGEFRLPASLLDAAEADGIAADALAGPVFDGEGLPLDVATPEQPWLGQLLEGTSAANGQNTLVMPGVPMPATGPAGAEVRVDIGSSESVPPKAVEADPLSFAQRPASAVVAPAVANAASVGGINWSVTRRETHFAPHAFTPRERSAAALAMVRAVGPDADVTSGLAQAGTVAVVAPTPEADSNVPGFEISVGTGGQTGDADGEARGAIPSPTHQVFARLEAALQEASDPSTSTARPSQSQMAGDRPTGPLPLRTLELALQPEGMGTVTVKLAVKNDTVWVQLDVSRADAAQMIDRDREVLSSLMKSAGYQVDDLSIRHVDADRVALPMTQAAADLQPGMRDSGGQSPFQDASSGGRFAQGQGHKEQPPGAGSPVDRNGSIRREDAAPARTPAGVVYI